jgi:acetyl-CoA carboxylase, biotin carboxylase subunit
VQKVLIANRGEIAVRIARACRQMGLRSVAVYSDVDRTARHIRLADEAVRVGESPPLESYLRIDRIIDAARASGADAVHPGYGFLSENPACAAACLDAGLTFIGPSPAAMALMGSKTGARELAAHAAVPVVPGTVEPLAPDMPVADVHARAEAIGYPLMLKAVAGGGGKGLRVVARPEELGSALRAARSEAASAFGDAAVYLERRLVKPRHIEVQVLADAHGTVLPFVERECSIQRRHQKLVEETPAPALASPLRQDLCEAAARVVREAGYTNAGTVEFLVNEDGTFYFLEMNARLQVEHPITEMVTGVDLVEWQIRIARGERLSLSPERLLTPDGHAMECRIYAEDPAAGFVPSPGRITAMRVPSGPGVRDDSGVEAGDEVPVFYDPLVSKLIVWGSDRAQAMARTHAALREYEIHGVQTTLPFFSWLLEEPAFRAGRVHTEFLDEVLQRQREAPRMAPDPSLTEVAAIAAALAIVDGASPAASASLDGGGRTEASLWTRRARLDALRS